MEYKKNPEKDLHNKYWLFLFAGGIVSLLITLGAFEWKTYNDLQAIELQPLEDEYDEVIEIPITEQPPPPPPVLQQPEIIEVPDEEEIEEQVDMELDVKIQETPTVNVPIKIDAPPPPPPKKEKEPEVFLVVEKMPEPKGGLAEFYKFVSKNLKYPKQARRMGVEGRVVVQFTVDTDGSLIDMKVLKGIGNGCDEEAMRVLKAAPKWNPGKQRGKPVKVKTNVPIVFKLR